jgi:hypothetical protein
MIVCIYCGETRPPGKEHVLSRTLGTYRGLGTLTRHLCRNCNERLGKLDEIFARTGPEALFRHMAGVAGRKHHRVVNPFYFHLSVQGGLRAMGKHPEYPFDVLWEVERGAGRQVAEARQIIFRRPNGYHEAIAIPPTGVKVFLTDEINRRNLAGCEPVAFFAGRSEDDPEFVEIKKALEELSETKGTIKTRTGVPGHVITMRAAFGITRDYLRAIAKIAFNYMLLQRPQYTGAEPMFENVRRFICDGEDFDDDCRLIASITQEVKRQGGLPHWTHFLAGEISYDEFAVRVQLFVGPDLEPPAWRVRLARNPSPIALPIDAFGHKFQLFETPAADGNQGEMLPLSVATSLVTPGTRDIVMTARSRLR